jgi:uncharacterized membrane protein SirB2
MMAVSLLLLQHRVVAQCFNSQWASSSATRTTTKRSFQDVSVSDGIVLMMLTAVSTKRAGTTIECSLPPSIYNLLGASTVTCLLSTRCPLAFISCKLCLAGLFTQRSLTFSDFSPPATVNPRLCKTVHCRHVFCLNNGLLLSDFRFYLKVYCRANAWRSITIVLPFCRFGYALETEESSLTGRVETTEPLVCLSKLHYGL